MIRLTKENGIQLILVETKTFPAALSSNKFFLNLWYRKALQDYLRAN